MSAVLQALGTPVSEIIGASGTPVVVAIGGISADHHVATNATNPDQGWWDPIVGPGRALDPSRCRILGFDFVVSVDGPTTTHQQAEALARVLDEHEIESVYAIVGASYGGMIALAFAELFPDRVGRLVLISAPHEAHPMTTAIRVVQRRILQLGVATGRPAEGVALARALGITTYRTAEEFATRFGTAAESRDGAFRFPVEEYLDRSGWRFASRFTAERYLALSESLDLHRVDPRKITTLTTIVAVESDTLVPRWQLEQLRDTLGGSVWFQCIRSPYGHDAFLKEITQVGRIIGESLALGGPDAA